MSSAIWGLEGEENFNLLFYNFQKLPDMSFL